jgi:nucleoside-diphosphate-sugar epimerase
VCRYVQAESVKAVVLTSSTAALFSDPWEKGRSHEWTEADWNTSASPTRLPYFYSKAASERRAYQLCERQSRWRLCSILPPAVWGPPLGPRRDGESVSHMVSGSGGGTAAPYMVDFVRAWWARGGRQCRLTAAQEHRRTTLQYAGGNGSVLLCP